MNTHFKGLPKTVSLARDLGSKYYFTGKACKHGHLVERTTRDGHCVACSADRDRTAYNKQRYLLNRVAVLESKKLAREADRIEFNRRQQEYRAANPDKMKAYTLNAAARLKRYYRANSEAIKKATRRNAAKNPVKYKNLWAQWPKEKKARHNALKAKRRAAQKKRIPAWLSEEDLTAIIETYKNAAELSSSTGVAHAVDHIIPLQGMLVSGLHVPSNLQVLTKSENSRKHNTFNVI